MMWGRKKIAGTVYDLTHLDPFEMEVPRPSGNGDHRVQVTFGAHTFTEKFTPLSDRDLAISNGKELRAFCLKRYGHSLHLPAAVLQAREGLVYLSQGKTLISARLPGLEGPYLIAFTLRPRQTSKFDAVMTVVSAHHRPNLDEEAPSARFQVVVNAALAGAKVRWTKK